MNLQKLADRLKTNPKPTEIELAIGWFIEELPDDLQQVTSLLISRGITPIIEEKDIIEWLQNYELYQNNRRLVFVIGMTNKQYLQFDQQAICAVSRLTPITLCLFDNWYSQLYSIDPNNLRLLPSHQADKFCQLWENGVPKEYKGIKIVKGRGDKNVSSTTISCY